MRSGWVKLHRELQEKSIWKLSTPEQKVILISILMLANHLETEWEFDGKKFRCDAGQFVTSLNSLAEACGKGISVQNVRTALNRFEKLGFLTNQSTKTGRLITIENWGKYQEAEKNLTNTGTNSSQTSHKDLTPIKNNKEIEEIKEIYISIVDYLNQKTGQKYKHSTKKTQTCIHARLAEGFTEDDFRTVIDKKCAEWIGTEWEKYLIPETLFGTKFESYLNAKVTKPVNTAIPPGTDQTDLDELF